MRERPILFKGQMVRAIIEGRKTQTRRVIKPEWWGLHALIADHEQDRNEATGECSPYGYVGDRLWVKETWGYDDLSFASGRTFYRADGDGQLAPGGHWRPSIHMRRQDSRIDLEITEVRIQRLKDITTDDAIAEGIEQNTDDGVVYYGPLNRGHCDPVYAFMRLWDEINAARGYPSASNPWVWAITFRRVEAGR